MRLLNFEFCGYLYPPKHSQSVNQSYNTVKSRDEKISMPKFHRLEVERAVLIFKNVALFVYISSLHSKRLPVWNSGFEFICTMAQKSDFSMSPFDTFDWMRFSDDDITKQRRKNLPKNTTMVKGQIRTKSFLVIKRLHYDSRN